MLKKIGVFTDRWLSGGIESYLVSNFEKMDRTDIEITILTTKKISNFYDERLDMMGISLIELLPDDSVSEVTRTYKSLKPFKEKLMNEKYDILHLNIYNGVSLIYSKVAQASGVKKIIAHSHNSAVGQVRLRSIKVLSHHLSKMKYEKYLSDYWACSDLAAEWMFTRKTKDRVKLMRNGVDTDKFKFDPIKRINFRNEHRLSSKVLVLGAMGRLNNQKNPLFLLSIAKELKKRGVSFVLLLAGEGELKNTIDEIIERDKLSDNVRLIGVIKDAPTFFSGIDMFLLPSLFEGNPIVGVESQCSGATCFFSNNITKQAIILNRTRSLSLYSPAVWVNEIVKLQYVKFNREKMFDSINMTHYDLTETSKQFKTFLIS